MPPGQRSTMSNLLSPALPVGNDEPAVDTCTKGKDQRGRRKRAAAFGTASCTTGHLDLSGMVVHQLTRHDVVLGRGLAIAQYEGNVLFRELIGTRRNEYNGTSRHRYKGDISHEILSEIQLNSGRFLRPIDCIDTTSAWVSVTELVALTKIKQALREACKRETTDDALPRDRKCLPSVLLGESSGMATVIASQIAPQKSPKRAIHKSVKVSEQDARRADTAQLHPGRCTNSTNAMLRSSHSCIDVTQSMGHQPNVAIAALPVHEPLHPELDNDLDPLTYHPSSRGIPIDAETALLIMDMWTDGHSKQQYETLATTVPLPLEEPDHRNEPKEPLLEYACPIVRRAECILQQAKMSAGPTSCSPTDRDTTCARPATPRCLDSPVRLDTKADTVLQKRHDGDAHFAALVNMLQSDLGLSPSGLPGSPSSFPFPDLSAKQAGLSLLVTAHSMNCIVLASSSQGLDSGSLSQKQRR